MFLKVEEKDEEALGLADALRRLDGLAGGEPFRAAEVLTWANLDNDEARALRAFLGGSVARPLTATAITRRLNEKKDFADEGRRRRLGLDHDVKAAARNRGIAQFGIEKQIRP